MVISAVMVMIFAVMGMIMAMVKAIPAIIMLSVKKNDYFQKYIVYRPSDPSTDDDGTGGDDNDNDHV